MLERYFIICTVYLCYAICNVQNILHVQKGFQNSKQLLESNAHFQILCITFYFACSDSTLILKAMRTLINYSTVRVGYSRLAESNMYIYWINGIEQILWPRSMFAPHFFFSSSFSKKTHFLKWFQNLILVQIQIQWPNLLTLHFCVLLSRSSDPTTNSKIMSLNFHGIFDQWEQVVYCYCFFRQKQFDWLNKLWKFWICILIRKWLLDLPSGTLVTPILAFPHTYFLSSQHGLLILRTEVRGDLISTEPNIWRMLYSIKNWKFMML